MVPFLAWQHLLPPEAFSGIFGTFSIICWVVVFSPQIIQNFRRGNADALSIRFILIWLLGDVFNIAGAVLQGVLPTMIILAVYYTLADLVLLAQCVYYRGFTWRDAEPKPAVATATLSGSRPSERTALLPSNGHAEPPPRHGSDWTNLSPAVPLVPDAQCSPPPPLAGRQTALRYAAVVAVVYATGVLAWFLGRLGADAGRGEGEGGDGAGAPRFDVPGQVFGYLCAAAYIGSRLPQLALNHRRKSTDGLSMLFFVLACVGNLAFVFSILVYVSPCARRGRREKCAPGEEMAVYGRYVLVNLSWLLGSLVTLFLDLAVFAQFFLYNKGGGLVLRDDESATVRGDSDEESVETEIHDEDSVPDELPPGRSIRPLFRRGDSTY